VPGAAQTSSWAGGAEGGAWAWQKTEKKKKKKTAAYRRIKLGGTVTGTGSDSNLRRRRVLLTLAYVFSMLSMGSAPAVGGDQPSIFSYRLSSAASRRTRANKRAAKKRHVTDVKYRRYKVVADVDGPVWQTSISLGDYLGER